MPRYLLAFLCIFGFSLALHAQSGDWKQLFDGKDLTGWKHVGPGYMTVEDGLIRTHGGMGLLYWTGGKLGDCTIHVCIKCAITTTTRACSFAFPSSHGKNGCRCITATKSRSTITRRIRKKTNTT